MEKRLITMLGLAYFAATMTSKAQTSDPREKFSISATVISSPDADYSWEMPSGAAVADGTMKRDLKVNVKANIPLLKTKKLSVSLSPFYNFTSLRMDTEWGTSPMAFSLPSAHHHYGSSLTLTYQLQAWGKPLTLIGMGTGNLSQFGYESAQGMLGAMMTLKRTRETYLAVGAIYLLGTAVYWPLYPMVVYSHRFNSRWNLNVMGVNNHLYYQASPKLKYSLGMELDASKLYFRPETKGLPERAQIGLLAERVGLFADWQAGKSVLLSVGAGVSVPFYVRLQESGYADSYMNLKGNVKPFLSLKAKYSIFRKQ